MYVTRTPVARSAERVPPAVLALGMVSFFTDISAEMVTAFLPVYLIYGLGVGYLQLGLLDGLYTGATAVLWLAGGHLADRLGRPKAVAAAGYGLSAATKLGFPLAGGSVPAIGGLLAIDRAGKGIRTGPRDAIIALVTPPDILGRAFGVHRMLDTTGALLGPVIVFTLLAWSGSGYNSVFVVSFCMAAVGFVVLLCYVDDPGVRARRAPVSVRAGIGLLARADFRRLCVLAVLLGAATVSDVFVLLAVQKRAGLSPQLLPLLPVAVAGTFLLAAVPLGRLADRLGRWRVFLAGHGLLLVVYGLLGVELSGWPVLIALGMHGLFYAATDGVLMAAAGPLLPAELKASGLAVLQTGQALARTVAAVLFGVAASEWGLGPAFFGYGVALLGALTVGWRWRQ